MVWRLQLQRLIPLVKKSGEEIVPLAFDDVSVFIEPDQYDNTTSTGTHTCSGQDRTLIVFTSAIKKFAPNTSVVSVKANGVDLTFGVRGVRTYSGDDNIVLEGWYMDNPPLTLLTIEVVWAHLVKSIHTTCLSYVGANNGIGAVDSIGLAPTINPSLSITTLQDTSFTVGACAMQGGDTDPFTPGGSQQERSDGATGLNNGRDQGYASSDSPSAGGAETHSYTASSNDDCAVVAMELKATGT